MLSAIQPTPTAFCIFPALCKVVSTQFAGQTFAASITGALTDFQFILNSSTITSLYGAVYAWDGSKPSTLLWQSPVISGIGPGQNGGGLFDFSPTGVNVTQGLTYVAFLSTYGI